MKSISFLSFVCLLMVLATSQLSAQQTPPTLPYQPADSSILEPVDTFPSLQKLLAAVDSFYASECSAALEEYQYTKGGKWMVWMPSIGAGYVPALYPGQKDRIRPTVSYSLANVEAGIRQKEQIRAKRQAISARNQLDARRVREKIWEMYARRTLLIEQFGHQKEVFEIDRQLFEFYTEEFKAVKIPADFYLAEKRKFLDRKFALSQSMTEINILEGEILRDAHFSNKF
jgi:hypothetical protein